MNVNLSILVNLCLFGNMRGCIYWQIILKGTLKYA